MRTPFQFSKTTVSMRCAELTDIDIGNPGQKNGKVVGVEWQVVYTKDGGENIHLARATEAEADADMDAIKAEADALVDSTVQKSSPRVLNLLLIYVFIIPIFAGHSIWSLFSFIGMPNMLPSSSVMPALTSGVAAIYAVCQAFFCYREVRSELS